ncbi:hypothetical protein Bca4012_078335 [Brassica carinata]
MANSFIILAELKNRDQSLQGRPIRSPSRSLSNFRYHLLATFDFKILVFCSLFSCCGIVLEDQRIDPLVLTLIAKNQKKPSETKPPMVHNLSHHFLPEALFSGFSSGTSALAALIFGRHLMVANAADGRAVLCRNGEAIDMYRDHKPIYLPLP